MFHFEEIPLYSIHTHRLVLVASPAKIRTCVMSENDVSQLRLGD